MGSKRFALVEFDFSDITKLKMLYIREHRAGEKAGDIQPDARMGNCFLNRKGPETVLSIFEPEHGDMLEIICNFPEMYGKSGIFMMTEMIESLMRAGQDGNTDLIDQACAAAKTSAPKMQMEFIARFDQANIRNNVQGSFRMQIDAILAYAATALKIPFR